MGKDLLKKICVVAVALGVVVLTVVPSGAQTSTSTSSTAPPTCLISIVPNPAPVGSFPAMTVTGFLPGEAIHLDALGLGGDYQADDTGTWSITFALPVPPELAGQTYDYFWTGHQSGATCSARLAFVAASATTAPAPPAEAAAVTAKPGFTG